MDIQTTYYISKAVQSVPQCIRTSLCCPNSLLRLPKWHTDLAQNLASETVGIVQVFYLESLQ